MCVCIYLKSILHGQSSKMILASDPQTKTNVIINKKLRDVLGGKRDSRLNVIGCFGVAYCNEMHVLVWPHRAYFITVCRLVAARLKKVNNGVAAMPVTSMFADYYHIYIYIYIYIYMAARL